MFFLQLHCFSFEFYQHCQYIYLLNYRGVGKWILKLMQEFFETDSGGSEPEELTAKGNLVMLWCRDS